MRLAAAVLGLLCCLLVIRYDSRIDRAINASLLMAFVSLKLGDRVGFFGFDVQPRLFSGAISGAHTFPLLQRLAARLASNGGSVAATDRPGTISARSWNWRRIGRCGTNAVTGS